MTTAKTAHPKHSAQHHAAQLSPRSRTIALVVVALAFIMDLLDSTIVNIAIPSIQSNLGASYTTIQWLVAGYSLAFSVMLITGGRMGDVFGYKKLFMLGVAGFTIASLLSGVAWTPGVLIGARLLQGVMAALMVPQVMSLMQIMYAPEERAKVMGLFGALGGLAASLGPIVGGVLIQANIFNLDWRPIFLINIPVGIGALIAAYLYLPDGKSAHPLKLDLIGTVIIITALLLLIFPLIEGRELNWPAWVFIMMAASLPIFALFGWWQVRKQRLDGSPLVIPSLFTKRSFNAGLAVNIVFEGAMLGYFLTFTLLLQAGLGFSVIKAALTGIPLAIGIGGSIGLVGEKLIPKLGRYVITIGTGIMAAGLWSLSFLVHHYGLGLHPWQVAPCLLLIGSGMGFIMAPIFAVVLNDVDPKHAGAASGTVNAVQQLGGAFGIALIGVLFFGQLSHHAGQSFNSIEPNLQGTLTHMQIPSRDQAAIISGVRTCFIDRANQKDSSNTPKSCEQKAGNASVGKVIESAAKQANAANFDHAFRAGVIYETVLVAIVFALSFLLPRKLRPEALQAV